MSDAPDFHCQKCGVETDIAPAVCESCCDDHDYSYDRDMRDHTCAHCGKSAPSDWHEED